MADNIRLPPRIQLRARDAITGSYPTVLRDAGNRTGIAPVFYDDTLAVIFTASTISYPTLNLPSSTAIIGLSSSITAPGNIVAGISDAFVNPTLQTHKLRPFDESAHPEQNVGATTDPFYLTGSAIDDVGPYFTSPLKSKTHITIDLSPVTEYSAMINNGVVAISGNPAVAGNWNFSGSSNYPMMYFNFSKRSWEGIGLGIPTSITGTQGWNWGNNPTGSVVDNIKNGMYGFAPSYAITSSLEGQQAATPITNFGFPMHPKFHATSSQVFHLSGVISYPFLVEKIVYEFSGSYMTGSLAGDPNRQPTVTSTSASNITDAFNTFVDQSLSIGSTSKLLTSNGATGDWGAPISTFFILNQRRPFSGSQMLVVEPAVDRATAFGNSGPHVFNAATNVEASLTVTIPSSTQISQNGSPTTVGTVRDIVTYAQVSALGSNYTDANVVALSRELNIKNCVDATEYWGGTYVVSSTVKSPEVDLQTMTAFLGINDVASISVLYNMPGGRNGFAQPTGRDLVTSVLGYDASQSLTINDPDLNGSFVVTIAESNSKVNPYILYPTDTLVFGWQVPWGKRMFADGRVGPADGRSSILTMKPGKGRLVIYGSHVSEGGEQHATLNQLLTSNAVHEIIPGDDHITDQFDTEPKQLLSGTYTGLYITGSMSDRLGRHVIGSTVTANDPGSNFPVLDDRNQSVLATIPGFYRGVQLVSDNERYYDTMMPPIQDIVHADGAFISRHGNLNQIIFGRDSTLYSPGGASATFQVDATWNLAFPYEPRYSGLKRSLNAIKNVASDVGLFGTDPVKQVVRPFQIVRQVPVSFITPPSFDFQIAYLVGAYNVDALPTDDEVLMHVYGVGDWYSGSVRYGVKGVNSFDNTIFYGTIARGFKYGVKSALPQFTKAIFRRDSYGQFRDMLEPRNDSKLYDVIGRNSDGTPSGRTGANASPVSVKFVEPRTTINVDPRRTWSSNLDFEATSSVPFFDGIVRNREEPIDLSLLNSVTVTI